ncbi:MAG: prephenate dehydrogenase/arogenate dehydrogenase family protein [Actinobacteria bacterium]|nr:prephenate dehydrogenase/arogenate dehydrogenase family protein [Actinomycetota bacterium]
MAMRKANVLGLGLIGGSLALALAKHGFVVSGVDSDDERATVALERGIISAIGIDPQAEISFVATPVSSIPGQVKLALEKTAGIVSDVGGVKLSVVSGVVDPRFVGGHPMTGSELAGLDGADESLFEGIVWVLTPTPTSSDSSFESLAKIIRLLGAEIVVLDAERHDRLVAVVSHLPHLTAATLMGLAHLTAEEHVAVLRLAAGGFRDMTRVASGQPTIWIDICRENKDAILDALNGMIAGLSEMKTIVEEQDTDALLTRLSTARLARANLPGRVQELIDVCEVRVPVPDRPGAAAEIFQLAADLGVNIANFEVTHSVEGDRGILVMVIDRANAEMFRGGLLARKFRPTIQSVA